MTNLIAIHHTPPDNEGIEGIVVANDSMASLFGLGEKNDSSQKLYLVSDNAVISGTGNGDLLSKTAREISIINMICNFAGTTFS